MCEKIPEAKTQGLNAASVWFSWLVNNTILVHGNMKEKERIVSQMLMIKIMYNKRSGITSE